MVVHERGEARGLVASLEHGRAEMDVVDVQRRARLEIDVDALAGALFTRPPRQIVVAVMDDREAAEDHVAEVVAAQHPHRMHDPAHAQGGADFLRLSGAAGAGADHFLQRHDVRLHVTDDVGDPRRHRPAVHAAAAVDVVGRDPQIDVTDASRVAHCCRSRIQTNGPTTFSHSGRRRQRSSVISSLSSRSCS